MRHLRKRALTGFVVASAALAVAGTASANSITLTWASTSANTLVYTAGQVPQTVGALLFANFSNAGGQGVVAIGTTVGFGANINNTFCFQAATLAGGATAVIGSGPTNATWGRVSGSSCAAGAGGGVSMSADIKNATPPAGTHPGTTTGTILLGALSFQLNGSGIINTFFTPALDGIGYVDGTSSDTTGVSFDSLSVNVIPEPATVALLATGMLGLLGFSRRWKV